MEEEYVTKELRCSRCEGTGLYDGENCLMCNGYGMRKVTLPKEEWSEVPDEQLQRL